MPTFHRFADLVVASELDLPELPSAAPSSADVSIRTAPVEHGPVQWFQSWGDDPGSVRFGRSRGLYVVEFPRRARVTISPDTRCVHVTAAPSASGAEIGHVLTHQVLPLVVSRRGRLVIHASAVSWRDRVIAFVGRTGAGKSTLAAACVSRGAALVTDDSLILDRAAEGWRALPSYPGLRVLPETLGLLSWPAEGRARSANESGKVLLMAEEPLRFEPRPLPLDRLFLVSVDAAGGGLRRVRGAEGAMALASQLFRLDVEDRSESRRAFMDIGDLSGAAPIFQLSMRGGSDDLLARVTQLLE